MKVICKDTNLCTGCTACASVCPKSCIDMIPNEEGFLYPRVDDSRCINCRLCEKTCPINNPPQISKTMPRTVVARTNNGDLLKQCSSGGVFTALASSFVKNKGIVYGVVYDTDFKVVHKRIDSHHDISKLAGSKYVQSDLCDIFRDIRNDLLLGNRVLFCGTPCQVAGLKNYLKMDYDNLYCVDLVCHGVPSPGLWSKYLKFITEKNGQLKSINFRSKCLGYHVSVMEECFSDGKKIIGSARTNIMSKIFFRNIADRYSCYDCKFKTLNRCSDLTIYDSWHADKLVIKLKDDDKGYTNVMIQTDKGHYLVDKFFKKNIITYDVDTETAIALDGGMATKSVKMHGKRDEFYNAVSKEGIESAVNMYLPIGKKDYLIERVKLFLYSVGILRTAKQIKELVRGILINNRGIDFENKNY